MIVTDIDNGRPAFKGFVDKPRTSYPILLNDRPIVDVALGTRLCGGQEMGKKHRVKEIYIDSYDQVFAGFIENDRGGQSVLSLCRVWRNGSCCGGPLNLNLNLSKMLQENG
jgi:hypothetical protein